MIGTILAIGGAIVVATGFGLVGWAIGTYNTFIVAVQDIKTQWSNIKTEYQRRADLFYNLVEAAKGYMKHERETLTKVIEARAGNFGPTKLKEMSKMKDLEKVFSKLAVVFERYPKLKANEQVNELMAEFNKTENRINIARTDYNALVRDYNIYVRTFPKNIIARHFSFKVEQFFENEPETNKAPKISF
jgi:LemA protein